MTRETQEVRKEGGIRFRFAPSWECWFAVASKEVRVFPPKNVGDPWVVKAPRRDIKDAIFSGENAEEKAFAYAISIAR